MAAWPRFYVIFATVDPDSGYRGITAFLVEATDEGLSCGPTIRKMGQRAIPNTELFLDDVFVPVDRRLGTEGEGFSGLMQTFDRSPGDTGGVGHRAGSRRARVRGRLCAGAGPVRQADRRAPGGRVSPGGYGAPGRCVASAHLAGGPDARPRGARDAPRRPWPSCTPPRLRCGVPGQPSRRSAAGATSREYPVEKWMRDAKLEEIEEGTSDIQRMIISRALIR